MSNKKRATSALSSSNYRLAVKDFGPIAKADVELRPLTVFIGPSNTGKSYLAILIYALHRFFSNANENSHPSRWRTLRRGEKWQSALMEKFDKERNGAQREFYSWAQKLSRKKIPNSLLPEWADYSKKTLEKFMRSYDCYGLALDREINRCFGTSNLEELVRKKSKLSPTNVALTLPQNSNSGEVRIQVNWSRKNRIKTSAIISRPKKITLPKALKATIELALFYASEFENDAGIGNRWATKFGFAQCFAALLEDLVQALGRDAYYLPSDRTGVMHSHQVVVSTLIQSATTAGLRPSQNTSMLSGVLGDFLGQLIRMSQQRSSARYGAHSKRSIIASNQSAQALEKNILQGAVRIDASETGYPNFLYRPKDWNSDIPLMRSSSMVSELAPVVLYLRHLVRPGDFLIIEEPESHLHPAMQALFAAELARLVNSGVRVLVTTHSEWLLDKFANLVRASKLNGNQEALTPENGTILPEENFGAWLFKSKKKSNGSIVEELNIDPDAGGLMSDYEAVAEQLYNEWASIENELAVRDKK